MGDRSHEFPPRRRPPRSWSTPLPQKGSRCLKRARGFQSSSPSSGIRALFGNLFGSKRHNTNPNVRESSVTQHVQAKSQAAATKPSSVPAQSKAATPEAPRTTDAKKPGTTKPQSPSPQQEPSAEPPADAGGARTTNFLVGAVPTVPAGAFDNRFGAWH
jgi:hypothetical protein